MDLTASEWNALILSLKVATTATFCGLPFALLAAHALAHRAFFGKSLIETLLNLPLVLPPVAIGYLLLIALSPTSVLGSWLAEIGIRFAFSWTGAALASFVMAFPLMVRAIRLSMEGVDPQLLEAAALLGVSPADRFFRVTLPLAVPGIIAGTVLAFARALGEFGATITFAANIPGLTQTLPLALYTATQSPDADIPALRLALLCTLPALISLLIGNNLGKLLGTRFGGAK